MIENIKLYRKLRGGLWRKIMIKRLNVPNFWTRNRTPFNEESVISEEDYRFSDSETDSISFINTKIRITGVCTDLISDGYHTFGELYEHRISLWIALCRAIAHIETGYQKDTCVSCWRSKLHSDGSAFEGWFVLGLYYEKGNQITYHLPMSKWDLCKFAETLEKAPEFDGHTSEDCLNRLKDL